MVRVRVRVSGKVRVTSLLLGRGDEVAQPFGHQGLPLET